MNWPVQVSFSRVSIFLILSTVGMAGFDSLGAEPPAQKPAFRPPAVPLVASNPYLSIWSMADRLTDDTTRHWTRREHPLVSLIRIDGKAYRLMGTKARGRAGDDTSRCARPAHPHYLRLRRRSRARHAHVPDAGLAGDLDVLARPLTYLTWDVRSTDEQTHSISIFDSTSARLAADPPGQEVEWTRELIGRLTALRVGTVDQTLLQPAGDDTRIDWGYVYAGCPSAGSAQAVGASEALADELRQRRRRCTDPNQDKRDSGTATDPDPPGVRFDEFRPARFRSRGTS